jgi:hypothetical protein
MMNIVPKQDLFFVFDDEAVRAMGAAFDQACRSLRHFAHLDRVRELVAKRIIEAAKKGERDPITSDSFDSTFRAGHCPSKGAEIVGN